MGDLLLHLVHYMHSWVLILSLVIAPVRAGAQ